MKSERIFTNAEDAKIFKGLCSSGADELRLALGQFDSIPPENQSRIIKELLQKAENEAHNAKPSRLEALAEGPAKITLGALAFAYVFFVLGMLPVNSYQNTHDGISYAPIFPKQFINVAIFSLSFGWIPILSIVAFMAIVPILNLNKKETFPDLGLKPLLKVTTDVSLIPALARYLKRVQFKKSVTGLSQTAKLCLQNLLDLVDRENLQSWRREAAVAGETLLDNLQIHGDRRLLVGALKLLKFTGDQSSIQALESVRLNNLIPSDLLPAYRECTEAVFERLRSAHDSKTLLRSSSPDESDLKQSLLRPILHNSPQTPVEELLQPVEAAKEDPRPGYLPVTPKVEPTQEQKQGIRGD